MKSNDVHFADGGDFAQMPGREIELKHGFIVPPGAVVRLGVMFQVGREQFRERHLIAHGPPICGRILAHRDLAVHFLSLTARLLDRQIGEWPDGDPLWLPCNFAIEDERLFSQRAHGHS